MGQVLTQNNTSIKKYKTTITNSGCPFIKWVIQKYNQCFGRTTFPEIQNFNDSLSLIMTALSLIDMEWCLISLFTAISIDQSFLQYPQTKDKWEKKTILYDCGTSISRISISFCIIFCKNDAAVAYNLATILRYYILSIFLI